MATLQELRTEAGWGLQEFADLAGVSVTTLTRIESCGRAHTSHPVQVRSAARITYALRRRLRRRITVEDIDGMHLQTPKPGRPKKHAD